jgi:methyl-accepting chemotaxis protein
MQWFLNLTMRAKLLLGFGVMLVLLAAVGVIAYRGLTALQESQLRLYNENFADAVDFLDLRADQNGIRAALLTMMGATTRSEQDTWHQEVKVRSREIEEVLQGLLRRYQNDPGTLRKLEEWKTTREAFNAARDTQVIPLIHGGKVEEARKLLLEGAQEERFQKLRALSTEMGKEAATKARAAVVAAEGSMKETARSLLLAGFMALVAGLAMAGTMTRVIANPLREVSQAAERIAAGDLTATVPAGDRADEVGALAQTFRRMVESLRELTRELQEGVNVLGASASEILATTTQVASGATETATAVGETTTTVEEVKQTAHVASQKAKYVSESAQKATQVAQAGRKAVGDTIEGMKGIREQMESIAESIVRLSEQSQAIGAITATVSDLAEQSNLLAVNAAIEAARAGEHGKGFAVVAQEVKSLAEQSRQATGQVRAILTDIQKATSAAVMATEQGSKAVAGGVRQSTEAGESIRALTESIAEAALAATQIAASSQQQLVGMDQVALAMENIKQATAQNVASTKQTEVAAQNLHALGQKLKELAGRYKV